MKRTKDNYHVKIYGRFLFEFKKQFASEYTRWVYVYLKLINNYKIQYKKEDYYPINVSEIAAFFNIDKATVFECMKDLRKFLLLSKEGNNKYRLEGEDSLMDLYYKANNEEGALSGENFVPIHRNLFIDIFNSGCSIREAELYYYLIEQNKHFAIDEPFLEVNIRNSKICSDLKTDHRTLKKIIINLLKAGLLIKDNKNKLWTRSPRPGFENCNFTPIAEKTENVMIMPSVQCEMERQYDRSRVYQEDFNQTTVY